MSSIRRSFAAGALLALAGLIGLPSLAHAQQKLVPAQSEIVFTSKQMGVAVDGYFKKFDAQLAFDPAKLPTSKIAFTVEMASATLGVPEADAELPKAVWFNVPGFPKATFQSSTIKALGGGKYEVAGQLTIKGRSNPVTVPVTLTQAGGTTTATGVFTLKRLAYAIGENQWSDTSMVADEVQVKFKLALTGVGKL
jgi:polyisoprenoid-binding protein YceI